MVNPETMQRILAQGRAILAAVPAEPVDWLADPVTARLYGTWQI